MTSAVHLKSESVRELATQAIPSCQSQAAIYHGRVMHSRLGRHQNAFAYPYYYFMLDVDRISEACQASFLFSYNKYNLFSIRDSDYLDRTNESISAKIRKHLATAGIDQPQQILLLTCPRVFGYVFNPVSFYYCFDRFGHVYCHVAEINNTFDERHLYILEAPKESAGGSYYWRPKNFHVSPFYSVAGDYEFIFSDLTQKLKIQINVYEQRQQIFRSEVNAVRTTMSNAAIVKNLVRYPLTLTLTMPRILWQAFILRYRKQAPVYRKPSPVSSDTILQRRYSFFERLSRRLVLRLFGTIDHGELKLREVASTPLCFGTSKNNKSVEFEVKHGRFYSLLASKGAMGLGESYIYDDWDSSNLTELLIFLYQSKLRQNKISLLLPLFEQIERVRHLWHANSLAQSRRNIRAHYDLGNEFFKLFLDPTLTYSSALFKRKDETLEQAQYNKIDRIIEQAGVQPGQHILEIGSGWGAMALRLAQKYGARVTTITLSENQAVYVRNLVTQHNLEKQITVEVLDYRQAQGQYDHIISIEMIEAVGKEYLSNYFERCTALLKPGGRFVFQVITMEDAMYKSYSRRADWIQKYIFPGAHLPSISFLQDLVEQQAGLKWINQYSLGQDYAKTIRIWDQAFMQQHAAVLNLGFDNDFIRMWHYYFCYCEAGFKIGHIDDFQVTLEKHE